MKYWIRKIAGQVSLIVTVILLCLCIAGFFNSYVVRYKSSVKTSSQWSTFLRTTRARLVFVVSISHFDAEQREDYILRVSQGRSSQQLDAAIEPNDANPDEKRARWIGWSHRVDPPGELQYTTWSLLLPLPLVALIAGLPAAFEFKVIRRRKPSAA